MPRLDQTINSPWDGLFAASLVGAVVAAYFAFLAPKPRPNDLGAAQRSLGKMKAQVSDLRRQAESAEHDAQTRTWSMAPEELGRRVMDDVGRVAERRRLTVANFQAGRTVDGAGLRQMAYSVTLEGAFPDVIDAVADFERPTARLAVSGIALAPQNVADAAPGRVSATVGLTAFVLRKEDE